MVKAQILVVEDESIVTLDLQMKLTAENVAGYPEAEPGEYVLLAVRDTGLGMSEKVKAHIFEPFFATEELGQGTGLGLVTVYGIVKQNRGNILVDSTENQDTTFKVYLPRAATTATAIPEVISNEVLLRGTEIILLVEDEQPVREFTALVLTPGISGVVLARRLLNSYPNLKVLIMSGYSTELSAFSGMSPGNPPLIQKPFSREASLRKIRDRFN